MTEDPNAAPPPTPPRRVSTQRAFIHTLSPRWMVALREKSVPASIATRATHGTLETPATQPARYAVELREARDAWALCLTAEHLVMGLEVLGDRRLLARAVCAVLRLALSRLTINVSSNLLQVLDVAEAWASQQPVSDDDVTAVIALANAPAERRPPGPSALMDLALRSLADVLDPDATPGLAAVGAVDVAADAWFDAGLSDDYDSVRLTFADEVRRVVDPWDVFAAATGEVELASDGHEPSDIPF